MWYAVQVHAGMEEQARDECVCRMDRGILEQCFVPYYEEKKKYLGAWHTEEKVLFAGYVFMVSSRPVDLPESLHKMVVQSGIVPLLEDEIGLLKSLGAGQTLVKMSTGIIVDGNVVITEGPLAGLEACIRKIDRHKRKAWLEVGMFGRMTRIAVGLEITDKIIEKGNSFRR